MRAEKREDSSFSRNVLFIAWACILPRITSPGVSGTVSRIAGRSPSEHDSSSGVAWWLDQSAVRAGRVCMPARRKPGLPINWSWSLSRRFSWLINPLLLLSYSTHSAALLLIMSLSMSFWKGYKFLRSEGTTAEAIQAIAVYCSSNLSRRHGTHLPAARGASKHSSSQGVLRMRRSVAIYTALHLQNPWWVVNLKS